ncbi:MAG: hypothetical protein ACE1ZQ_00360 [Ignavibacteriaceae bacterium]
MKTELITLIIFMAMNLNAQEIGIVGSIESKTEMHVTVINNTNDIISYGDHIYISGYDSESSLFEVSISWNPHYHPERITIISNKNILPGYESLIKFEEIRYINTSDYISIKAPVSNINTSGYSVGDRIYVSSEIPGATTNIKPVYNSSRNLTKQDILKFTVILSMIALLIGSLISQIMAKYYI